MSFSIDLYFFYFQVKLIDRFQFSFQTEEQKITNNWMHIPIPESVFIYGKDKCQMSIKLFEVNSDKNQEFNFYIYYGENKAYIQLDKLVNKTYEIILRSIENLKIVGIDNEFTELDSIENTDRKRLVLINYLLNNLTINNETYYLDDIIKRNYPVENSNLDSISSYQISEIDLKNKTFIVKSFEPKDYCDMKFLVDEKDHYKLFSQELDKLNYIHDDNDYKTTLNEIDKNYRYLSNYDFINFNKTNEYLEKSFKTNNTLDIDLFFNFFKCCFFFEYLYDFLNNRSIMLSFISKIEEIFEIIKEKDNNIIPIYEKVRALNALFFTYSNCKDINELIALNIKYYFLSEIEENSILDRVMKFFDKYIDELNEKSVAYENLLFLDGGHGYYNKEKVYTYDLTNLKMLKSHLKEVLPKILIFCYIENDEIALTTPEFGGILINEFHLLKNHRSIKNYKYIDYNYPYCAFIKEEELNDIAMNITLNLIHEIMGHKKYALCETGIQSPKKIVNKKSELIELKHMNEYNPNIKDNNEYILTSDKSKGDSGHFLELCYGKVNNILITKLLFDMKNKGKLINRADLFVDSGQKLKEYVLLRKTLEKRKIKFNFNNNKTIENDIEDMNLMIKKLEKEEDKKEIVNIHSQEQEEKELLSKKRVRDYKIIDEQKDLKSQYNPNAMKYYEIKSDKKEEEIENNIDEYMKIPKFERLKNKTREEIIAISKKRIMKKYNFKYDEKLRYNLIKKFKELKPDDPYFDDFIFFISDLRRTV